MLITAPFDLKLSSRTYSVKLRELFSLQASYMLGELEERKLEKMFIAYHRPKYNTVDKDQQTDQLCFYKKSNAFNDCIPF